MPSAPVELDRLAGDETCAFGCEKRDGRPQFFGLPGALQLHASAGLLDIGLVQPMAAKGGDWGGVGLDCQRPPRHGSIVIGDPSEVGGKM